MKSKTPFSVLLVVVFVFSTAAATKEAVVDSDGEPLRTGVEYYVEHYNARALGGVLVMGRSSKQSCPEIVVYKSWWDTERGSPVTFSNVDPNDDVVRESSDVNIEFVPIRSRLCPTTTVWKVDDYDASTGKWWVTTDGVKGNPGPNTLTSWFKIESGFQFRTYKLTFCPSVCDSCINLCNGVGVYGDGEHARLALTDERFSPYEWKFRKANKTKKQ